MIICKCKGVTKREIQAAIRNGARTLSEIQELTKASTGCGRCKSTVQELLEKELQSKRDPQLRINFD